MITGAPAAEDGGGRQHERTGLAWARTGLALTAVALLVGRGSGPGQGGIPAAAEVAAIVVGLVVMAARTRVLARRPTAAQPPAWVPAALVAAVLVLQFAGLAAVR